VNWSCRWPARSGRTRSRGLGLGLLVLAFLVLAFLVLAFLVLAFLVLALPSGPGCRPSGLGVIVLMDRGDQLHAPFGAAEGQDRDIARVGDDGIQGPAQDPPALVEHRRQRPGIGGLANTSKDTISNEQAR